MNEQFTSNCRYILKKTLPNLFTGDLVFVSDKYNFGVYEVSTFDATKIIFRKVEKDGIRVFVAKRTDCYWIERSFKSL